jgi:iron complex transport system permease protein
VKPLRNAAVLLVCAAFAALALALGAFLDVDLGAGGARSLGWFDLSDPGERSIFVGLRLPRVLAAAAIGAGLGVAGAAFQALLRNPLAEPYTLGVASGASLAAVIAIRFGLASALGTSAVGVAALIGSLATVALVYRLARVGNRLPPATLLLAGITIAMFCSAATMLLQYTADFTEVYRIVRWMMGGLDAVRYTTLLRAAIAIAVGVAAVLYLAPDLNALAGGEEAAASVGVDVRRTVFVGLGAASLIVGAAIAVAGPIGFVGLIVPHALRAVVGPDHRVLIPASALGGAGLLCLCDTLAHLALAPAELPVGVVTAVLGGPFFLYLLVRHKGTSRLWGL